ncbi:MAG: class I SAM-dependent methyltransferase [Cyclobacteriaceae bacterium]|nr:class I SAM-dependent methyltransferase [Cyclobacteriaceae bacterium]
MDEAYKSIVRHYEACLAKHGDSHLGVDWPNTYDAMKRYLVMEEIVKFCTTKRESYTLLDFGCGAGHFLEYLKGRKVNHFHYSGCDLSDRFIALCNAKFPGTPFFQVDALKTPEKIGQYDIILMNGVFTEKRELSFDQMWGYFKQLVSLLFHKSSVGIALNVMSKHVDWERDDLFHLSHDLLVGYLVKNLTRNFVIRNDYGLYEYTVYIYR